MAKLGLERLIARNSGLFNKQQKLLTTFGKAGLVFLERSGDIGEIIEKDISGINYIAFNAVNGIKRNRTAGILDMESSLDSLRRNCKGRETIFPSLTKGKQAINSFKVKVEDTIEALGHFSPVYTNLRRFLGLLSGDLNRMEESWSRLAMPIYYFLQQRRSASFWDDDANVKKFADDAKKVGYFLSGFSASMEVKERVRELIKLSHPY